MSRFLSELAAALAGTFPRDDPHDAIWVQPQGSALVRGPAKGQASDNHAMSDMYAAIRAYEGLESTYWTLTSLRDQGLQLECAISSWKSQCSGRCFEQKVTLLKCAAIT